MTILTWFDQKSLSSLVPDHAVIIGGTILVHEFMSLIEESSQPGQLLIAVPYITAALVAETRTWQGVVHERLDCTLVTRETASRSCVNLRSLPWRSLQLKQDKGAHAKNYIFRGEDGYRAALIGSHNFTFAGTMRNREAGVLLISRTPSELTTVIDECFTYVTTNGTTCFDSMVWPEEQQKRKIA